MTIYRSNFSHYLVSPSRRWRVLVMETKDTIAQIVLQSFALESDIRLWENAVARSRRNYLNALQAERNKQKGVRS